MEQVDTVVIGAGVVGLACARALALAGREVLILERESTFGTGISARNSEVIHAGLYYPPGSLKATLCVQGREQLYRYCLERGVGHARTGKLVVATAPGQVAALQTIQRRAEANGVTNLRLLRGVDIVALEPQLDVQAALLSPSSGIVDSGGLMLSLLGDAQRHGAVLATHSSVKRGLVRAAQQGIELAVEDSAGAGMTVLARRVINAAGLDAPAFAGALQGLPEHSVPCTWFARGSYFSYSGKIPFKRLIYPLPEPGGLGVHLTLDLAGQGKFGPDVEWIDAPDFRVDTARSEHFYRAIRPWWPTVDPGKLVPAWAAVRPKLAGPGMADADFRIDGARVHGVPGLVNLFGIESPGLTACLAIADHVAAMV